MKTIRILIILLILSVFVFGCKSKKVLKNESKTVEKLVYNNTDIKDSEKTETVSKSVAVKKELSELIKSNKTDIQIKGTVNPGTPLIYYNIVNGDTLDNLSVSGSAQVIYNSYRNDLNSDKNYKNDSTSASQDKRAEKSTNIIEGVASTVKAVQNKTVQVVKKDFQFGVYITILIWGLAIIAIVIIILWIRKSTFWKDIFTKIKNN